MMHTRSLSHKPTHKAGWKFSINIFLKAASSWSLSKSFEFHCQPVLVPNWSYLVHCIFSANFLEICSYKGRKTRKRRGSLRRGSLHVQCSIFKRAFSGVAFRPSNLGLFGSSLQPGEKLRAFGDRFSLFANFSSATVELASPLRYLHSKLRRRLGQQLSGHVALV